jgi:hypothetical protein
VTGNTLFPITIQGPNNTAAEIDPAIRIRASLGDGMPDAALDATIKRPEKLTTLAELKDFVIPNTDLIPEGQ